ncbi:MAG TPA: hypothetical protein VJP78_06105 [Thermoleophilia bacterium]|nr:hypothetical protein [Thermoleophilia bacterium]
MSEKINCGNCDMLLYFGEEIQRRLYMRAIPNEESVYESYGKKCPRCGNPLADDSVKITFKRRRTHVSQ